MGQISPLNSSGGRERPGHAADAAEHIIASLALSLLYCRLQDNTQALDHISQAHEALLGCNAAPQTLRPGRTLKMVRIRMDAAGAAVTALLPIIEGSLLGPSAGFPPTGNLYAALDGGLGARGVLDAEIGYYTVRLRTGRLERELVRLAEQHDPERLAPAIQGLLMQCIHEVSQPAAPLDVADDYLNLAINFARLRNLPLARLALTKAGAPLHGLLRSVSITDHRQRAQRMIDQIANLTTSLMSMAS
jgi:hypothetical protein